LTVKIPFEDRVIEIRLMDDSYILCGDMRKFNLRGKYGICTADRPLIPQTSSPNRYFKKIHEVFMHRYGTGAFLAWDNNKVVGFINFHPDGIELPAKLCLQEDFPAVLKKLNDDFPHPSNISLRIRCVSLAPEYRKKGLAKALVSSVIDWAKRHGFREIRVRCPKSEWTIPPRFFWEKLGFSALFHKEGLVEMSIVV
jgi:GNAT superfamily N-acetyltransferase